jgi:hypothetical protein
MSDYGQMIAAGTCNAGSTVTITERTGSWLIIQHTGSADATALFNGRFTVQLAKHNAAYLSIEGNYQTMTASGNDIDYVVLA